MYLFVVFPFLLSSRDPQALNYFLHGPSNKSVSNTWNITGINFVSSLQLK